MTMLAMNTSRHQLDAADLPVFFHEDIRFHDVFIDNKIRIWDALINILGNSSYNINRFISEDYKIYLKLLLRNDEFDIIHLDGLFLAPYVDTIRELSKAKIVKRAHNVEYKIWEKLADQRIGLTKWYLKLLARRLKQFEVDHMNDYDLILPITKEDENIFKGHGLKIPSRVVPFGLEIDRYDIDNSNLEFPSIFFIGSLEWMPNMEGIKWFLEKVWKEINSSFPEVNFYIAGRGVPDWLLNLKEPGVEVLGEVEESAKLFQRKGIMVVPLFSGSGMRVKIIEGMAYGKPIISTSVGAEGIPYTDKKDILITDTSKGFINCLSKCIVNKEYSLKLGQEGRSFISKNYDNAEIISSLLLFYKQFQAS